MVDINKYEELITLIDSYNEVLNAEEARSNKLSSEHPLDDFKITADYFREKDIIESKRLAALKKEFPNINFSIEDVKLLSDKYTKMSANYSIVNKVESALTSQSNGGRTVHNDEIEKMEAAKARHPELKKQHEEAYASFFEVCEKLNDHEVLENPEFDFEDEIFSKMYEQGLSLRPLNPILKKYYIAYKIGRNNEKENETLVEKNSTLSEQVERAEQENIQLKNDNENLISSNNELEQKNSKLQSMLAKTLEFCEEVRESSFGKFFFRKKLKELPEPRSIEEER